MSEIALRPEARWLFALLAQDAIDEHGVLWVMFPLEPNESVQYLRDELRQVCPSRRLTCTEVEMLWYELIRVGLIGARSDYISDGSRWHRLNLAPASLREPRRSVSERSYSKQPFRVGVREQVLKRDGRCRLCFSTERLTVDHIFPERLGGSAHLDNLQALCQSCNLSKNIRLPMEIE